MPARTSELPTGTEPPGQILRTTTRPLTLPPATTRFGQPTTNGIQPFPAAGSSTTLTPPAPTSHTRTGLALGQAQSASQPMLAQVRGQRFTGTRIPRTAQKYSACGSTQTST